MGNTTVTAGALTDARAVLDDVCNLGGPNKHGRTRYLNGVQRGKSIGEVSPPTSVMVWLGVVSAVDWV